MKKRPEKLFATNLTTATQPAGGTFFGRTVLGNFFDGTKENKRPVIQTKSEESDHIQRQPEQRAIQTKSIINGGEIIEALNKTEYGRSLIEILNNSGLEYVINIKSGNNGKFGDPKKNEKDGTLVGYQLNFLKYDPIELAGTRYDHAGKDEYYGGIAAHDIIDTSTPEGIAINKKKDEDWANPDSDFRKSFDTWANAKAKNKESAKIDFFQFLIDNYEKIGMDAEYKFRSQIEGNTLNEPIGELSYSKQQEGNNPDLKGKTPKDIYNKGVK